MNPLADISNLHSYQEGFRYGMILACGLAEKAEDNRRVPSQAISKTLEDMIKLRMMVDNEAT